MAGSSATAIWLEGDAKLYSSDGVAWMDAERLRMAASPSDLVKYMHVSSSGLITFAAFYPFTDNPLGIFAYGESRATLVPGTEKPTAFARVSDTEIFYATDDDRENPRHKVARLVEGSSAVDTGWPHGRVADLETLGTDIVAVSQEIDPASGATFARHDGADWQAMSSPAAGFRVHDMLEESAGTLLVAGAVGAEGRAYRFEGGSWALVATAPSPLASAFATSDGVYTGDIVGRIYGPGSDVGLFEMSAPIARMRGTGPSDMFALSATGGLAHFDGNGWSTVLSSATDGHSLAVTVDAVYVGGSGIAVLERPGW
jgi:hypothetical protein